MAMPMRSMCYKPCKISPTVMPARRVRYISCSVRCAQRLYKVGGHGTYPVRRAPLSFQVGVYARPCWPGPTERRSRPWGWAQLGPHALPTKGQQPHTVYLQWCNIRHMKARHRTILIKPIFTMVVYFNICTVDTVCL
jgi:hypothetical protein